MNILVVLKKLKDTRELKKKHDILLKHAQEWSKKGNEIYILTNIKSDDFKNSGIHFVNPPGYLSNHTFTSLWFSLVNHPRFDFVIEEFSFLPFIEKRSDKAVYWSEVLLPQRTFQKISTYFFLKFFYKKEVFVTSSLEWFEILRKSGVGQRRAHLLKRGLDTRFRKPEFKKPLGKRVLFVARNNLEEVRYALEVFKNIERRDLGWKFTLIVAKDLYHKAVMLTKRVLETPLFLEMYSPKVVRKQILATDILLDINPDEDSLHDDMLSLMNKNLVIAGESESFEEYPEFVKSIVLLPNNDFIGMAKTVLDYAANPEKYKKKFNTGTEFVKSQSWEKLADESLSFLEN